MATISFSTTFDLTLSPIQAIFTDTSDYSGQAIPLVDVVGSFTITAPSGVVIYNNTDITNAGCDIDIVNSLVSQQIIALPLDSFLLPEIGNYTIVYRVWNSALSVFYTITNVVNYQYVAPEICINQRIDCISPLFSSVDATDYTVNGIIPAIVGTHTLDYPFGSAGEGVPTILPFTAEASVIAVSIFYQGTQTTEIVAGLTYAIITGVNSFIVIDSISGKREIKVDCAYICSILCCIRTYEKIKESFKNTNAVKFREYDEIFHEIMSYVGLMQFSIECGLGDEVCDYLQKIKILSNCSDACKCSSENASRVIGLGYLIGPAGPAGPQGGQGSPGNNGNYVTVTAEAPGVNCVNGGQKVILYNGITNAIISTNYICNGAAGAPGAAGTNAFKAVKEFTTLDIEQTLTITYAEKIFCGLVPNGCMIGAATPNAFLDQVIQVWHKNPLDAFWTLLVQGGITSLTDYSLIVDNATGLITILTGNNQGLYRVVIIA